MVSQSAVASELLRLASRVPSGADSPRRYFPVSSPLASGKYGNRLCPVCSRAGTSSSSMSRLSQEYSFWAETNAW